MATATSLHCLVACTACKRQFDAGGAAAGSRFHCSCGELIEVPRFNVHEAAVVRCSSCSAPRANAASSCQHCSADFTLHERDLHTVCPSCMTRVSDRARYCHHCATPIVPQGSAGEQTTRPCPACGRRHKLYGRSLGDPAVSLLECLHCAGIWLTLEAFEIVAQRSREKTLPEGVLQRGPEAPEQTDGPAGPGDKFYRHCPQCRKLMNRRNFGKRSGVVIDSCKDHGIWFDARELGAILSWMRKGGEGRVARQSREEARQAERLLGSLFDL